MVRLPSIRTVTRCATNLEERVNHEDFSECNNVQWIKHVLTMKAKHVKEVQVVLEYREVIDQLLDDQMNHVSSAKRVY